jgi:hypothetical protein
MCVVGWRNKSSVAREIKTDSSAHPISSLPPLQQNIKDWFILRINPKFRGGGISQRIRLE